MEHDYLAAVGDRMRSRRNSMKLTREEFAELADISAGYYGQLEIGTSQMSLDTLIKISKASNLSTDYILFGEPEPAGDLTLIESFLANRSERDIKLAERFLMLYFCKVDMEQVMNAIPAVPDPVPPESKSE